MTPTWTASPSDLPLLGGGNQSPSVISDPVPDWARGLQRRARRIKCRHRADDSGRWPRWPAAARSGWDRMTDFLSPGLDADAHRRRSRLRAWHLGTRELELVFGRFADVHLAG